MKKWDVVLLAYPFTDLSAIKVRPAVLVSPDAENRVREDAVFLMITSNTDRDSVYDMVIEDSHLEFGRTGLKKSSAVRANKLFTLKKTLVKTVLGSLGPDLRRTLSDNMRRYFEF